MCENTAIFALKGHFLGPKKSLDYFEAYLKSLLKRSVYINLCIVQINVDFGAKEPCNPVSN